MTSGAMKSMETKVFPLKSRRAKSHPTATAGTRPNITAPSATASERRTADQGSRVKPCSDVPGTDPAACSAACPPKPAAAKIDRAAGPSRKSKKAVAASELRDPPVTAPGYTHGRRILAGKLET